MTFTELGSPDELTDFINSNDLCVVTFSATCKQSKPELQAMATSSSTTIPIGYVYESDLEDDDYFNNFQTVFLKSAITGFPTYILFQKGAEVDRINGVNFNALQEMIAKYGST